MVATPRYLARFESIDSETVVTFPLKQYEYQQDQATANPSAPVVGANYEFRLLGSSQAPKGNGVEHVRFLAVELSATSLDDTVDALKSELFSIGLGKLFTVGADDSERWAYAQLDNMPSISMTVENKLFLPVMASFNRYSDWLSPDDAGGDPVIMDDGSIDFTINNPGNAIVYDVVIIVKGTYTVTLTLTNNTTGDIWASTQEGGSADDWTRIDAGHYAAEFSSDAGVNYSSIYSAFSLPDGQVHFMRLAPGDNDFTISNDSGMSTDATIEFHFFAAWH